ncbi:MAG: penicillin-binding protein activator [Candidatus Zixiibacteriota bacterium]|nr:MAG: penicillin-binding protein activator [candidate division Zixibacteria bacterium]
MATRVTRTVTAICLIGVLMVSAGAETISDAPEVISQYEKGKRLLREGDWFAAVDVFQELEARFPQSPNLDLFVFNRAKARLYLGQYSEAGAAFTYFISRFPGSPIKPHAYFFLANSEYLRGNISRAVGAYLKAYELTRDESLEELVKTSLLAAFASAGSVNLTDADFRKLPQDKACALILPLSEIQLQRGEVERATNLLAYCGEAPNLERQPDLARRLSGSDLEIALVLPLSGELESFGQDIYNGAAIAAEMFREETGQAVRLQAYDTRGEAVEAARIIGDLAVSTVTDVVVGPLTSEEAAVASAALSCASLPMVAPAATQAGLTRLSSSSFQLAPNVDLEGVTLAEYAVRRLEADSVAIISSTDSDHLRMARAFARHFERLGGKVVAVEYYRSRDRDFGAYIRDIKAVLLGHPPDSTFFINANGDTLDFDIVPASIDCIFLPGDTRQLRQLLPQIHFYNLNGSYLGSDGWGDEEVYKLGDDVTKGAVFASAFLEGKRSDEYMKLAAAHDRRYGSRPQRLAALGYDAVRLICRAALAGGTTRDNIATQLQLVRDYDGASGRISFGESRENIEMPLYRIENERSVLLGAGETGREDFGSSGP